MNRVPGVSGVSPTRLTKAMSISKCRRIDVIDGATRDSGADKPWICTNIIQSIKMSNTKYVVHPMPLGASSFISSASHSKQLLQFSMTMLPEIRFDNVLTVSSQKVRTFHCNSKTDILNPSYHRTGGEITQPYYDTDGVVIINVKLTSYPCTRLT